MDTMFRKIKSPGHSRSLLPQRGNNANLPGHNEATANVDMAYRTEQDMLGLL